MFHAIGHTGAKKYADTVPARFSDGRIAMDFATFPPHVAAFKTKFHVFHCRQCCHWSQQQSSSKAIYSNYAILATEPAVTAAPCKQCTNSTVTANEPKPYVSHKRSPDKSRKSLSRSQHTLLIWVVVKIMPMNFALPVPRPFPTSVSKVRFPRPLPTSVVRTHEVVCFFRL